MIKPQQCDYDSRQKYQIMQVGSVCSKIHRMRYTFMNSIAPHIRLRWAFTLAIVLVYVVTSASILSDLITYLIAFYLLTIAINYFTPRGVSSEIDMDSSDDEQLYNLSGSLKQITVDDNRSTFIQISKDRGDDKPLVRSLCEQAIWARTTTAFGLGAICSYFKMLEIDVFWPLLLLYFSGLAFYTIFKILKTMDRYRYNLSDFKKGTTNTFHP